MTYEIHNCDSIKFMEGMVKDGRKVELCVTDPPYRLTQGGRTGEMGGCFDADNYDNKGGIVQCDIDWPDFMPLLYAVLADQAHCYVMANNRNVQAMLNSAESAGFRFHNLLAWDKITATPNRWFMKNIEFIGFFYKGAAKYINDCSAKQLIRCPQVDETDHPTEKPVALFENFIRQSSQDGDTVLDPFMGVGSAGVAALRLKRRFLGLEIEKKWYDVAEQRLNAATSQERMF